MRESINVREILEVAGYVFQLNVRCLRCKVGVQDCFKILSWVAEK